MGFGITEDKRLQRIAVDDGGRVKITGSVGVTANRFQSLALPNTYDPIDPSVAVTTLQTGHGFTNNAGGSANLNDTTDYVLGTQAVSVTTDGLGTSKTIKRTGMTAFSSNGRIPRIWIKVNDNTNVSALQLYMGDTNLANYFRWEMKSSATQKWLTNGEWHCITLPWGDATITGSPNRSSITDVQFRIVDNASAAVTVHFNGLMLVDEQDRYPNGVVSFSFDDTYLSHYTVARPKLDQYGFGATAYTIQDYVGGSGRMTLDQLKLLETYSGWEVSGHASTGAIHAARFTSLTDAQLETEYQTIKNWLSINGFKGDTIAYPGGEFNPTVLAKAEQYFIGGRTTFKKSEVIPAARRSKIRCGGYVTSSSTVAELKAAVDKAYDNKEWLILNFHDLVSSITSSTDYLIADFQELVDYVNTKNIAVRTIGSVLKGDATSGALRPKLSEGTNLTLGTTTGTKIGTSNTEKLGFWAATPIVRPTTAGAAATFVTNTSLIANDSATFDGYTLGQVVKALRNAGILT